MSDTTPLRALGIVGSLRAASMNRVLLQEVARLAPPTLQVDIGEHLRLPLFDEDLEKAGEPAEVVAAKAAVRAAQAVVIATPEYNFGIPGPLKNFIDWMSRPAAGGAFMGKPVLVVGASNGGGGTLQAQAHLRSCLAVVGASVYPFPPVAVPFAVDKLASGTLTDERTLGLLGWALGGFADFARRLQP